MHWTFCASVEVCFVYFGVMSIGILLLVLICDANPLNLCYMLTFDIPYD